MINMIKALPAVAVVCLLQGCLIPVSEPEGEYGVGTQTLALEDVSRAEVMTTDTADHRKMLLQFWYPTEPHNHLRLSRYLELVPKTVNSLVDAPMIDDGKPLPLVIMSHGLGGNANHSEFISESLAANGYLVAGIDHTYYGGPVRFPDGSQLSSILNMLRFTGPNLNDDKIRSFFDVWVQDCHFLLSEIDRLNADPESEWYQRIDTDRIAMVSHSFGGAMGMECALEESRIVANVNMDGDLWGNVKQIGTATPFMMIWPGDASNSIANRFEDPAFALSDTFYWASITNGDHGDFADHNRLLNPGGEPDIFRKQKITLDLIHAFLDRHFLMRQDPGLLDGVGLDAYPELRLGAGVPGETEPPGN